MIMDEYVDTMVQHYAVAALWSSTGDDGEPLDGLYTAEDIDLETWDAMAEDCSAFVLAARDGEWNGTGTDLIGDMSAEQCGHDLWLTRNGHGAGFWDRGLGERGDRLSDIARPFGEVHLYIGDDNMIHGE